MSNDTAVDRFYRALERGDVAGASACCAADVLFWHNFDGIAQNLEVASNSWTALVTHTAERKVEDVRRQTIADGFLQQHMFVVRTVAGDCKAWAVCIIVRVADGLITRFEEYIDRAGSFAPGEGAVVTPGFP